MLASFYFHEQSFDPRATARCWGAKVPLPYGPGDGPPGLQANRDFLAAHRASVGADFPLTVDCYMSLTVPYAIDLANTVRDLNLYWMEECLQPDGFDGHTLLKTRAPWMKWTTDEHEYTRYGFRKLIETRSVDILQPDMRWLGGLTEAMRVAAMAAAYDIPSDEPASVSSCARTRII